MFGCQVIEIRGERKHFNFRYASAAYWIQFFRDYYGPTHKACAMLDEAGKATIEADITALLERLNVAGPDSLVVPAEYTEVVITRH